MATTLNLYDNFRKKQLSGNGAVNLTSLTVKIMLVTSAYTPNQNTHDFRDDLGATEVSGTGYTAGGNTIATITAVLDGSGNLTIDGNDPATWLQNAAGFSNARRAVIYVARGGAASADELIAYSNDFGADLGNVAADLSIQLNAAGLITSAR
jgi:hypothetical protein